ncbi:hypothetical protein CapIbe_009004 [Capra ibex]
MLDLLELQEGQNFFKHLWRIWSSRYVDELFPSIEGLQPVVRSHLEPCPPAHPSDKMLPPGSKLSETYGYFVSPKSRHGSVKDYKK